MVARVFWAVARVFKGVARVVARVSCMVELTYSCVGPIC